MKITKYLCLACSLVMFSCDKNETDGTDGGNNDALSFTASITAQVNAESRLTTNNSWAGMSDNGIGVKIGDVVKKYTVSETGIMTSDSPFYWNELSSSSVTVSAWYPYNEGVKPEVIVCADQSIPENFLKSDYLECDMEISKENTSLVFTHAGAKIVCNVTLDPSLDASLNASKVMLYGLSGVDEGTSVTTNGAREALVAPQTIPANHILVGIELSDGRYTEMKEGGLDEELVIEKGYYYPLNITVYASEIVVTCSGAAEWEGSSDDVDAESPNLGPNVDGDGWEQNGDDTDVDGGTDTVSPGNGENGSSWGNGGTQDVEAGKKNEQSDSENPETK